MLGTPGCYGSICENRSKGSTCRLNPLDVSKPILDLRAVTSRAFIAPGSHWSICQECSEGISTGMDRKHLAEPVLDCRAVTTAISWVSPSNKWPIFPDRSKCNGCSLEPLYILKLALDFLSPPEGIAPGNHWTICQDLTVAAPARSAAQRWVLARRFVTQWVLALW